MQDLDALCLSRKANVEVFICRTLDALCPSRKANVEVFICRTLDALCLSRKANVEVFGIKVVIITNLKQNKNLHKMLKIQQIFPKLYRCLLYVVFHTLKPQNAGLVGVKKDLN